MNYRRGFQRLYAVAVVSWVTFVLFTTQSGRWKPWPAMPHSQWEIESERPIDSPNPSNKEGEPKLTVSPEEFLRNAAHQEERHRAIVRWSWVAGLALIPPILGYLLLFCVSPWIYRGFTPAHLKNSSSTHL